MQNCRSRSRGYTRLYSQIGLAGTSILSGCDNSDVSPATFAVSMKELLCYLPLSLTTEAEGTVRWTTIYTDPYAPYNGPRSARAGEPDNDFITSLSAPNGTLYHWIVPVEASSVNQWYYHCRFHGVAREGHHLGAGLAGVITVSPRLGITDSIDDSEPFDLSILNRENTFSRRQRHTRIPAVDFAQHAPDDLPAWGDELDGMPPGQIHIWSVPYAVEAGSKWYFQGHLDDRAENMRTIDIELAGVAVLEYLDDLPIHSAHLLNRCIAHTPVG